MTILTAAGNSAIHPKYARIMHLGPDLKLTPLTDDIYRTLVECDGRELITESVTMEELESTFFTDIPVSGNSAMLEAITSTRARLDNTMRAFVRALNGQLTGTNITAGTDTAGASEGEEGATDAQTIGGAIVGRVRNVNNIPILPAQIPLSDGQSVSVVFLSPTAEKKIAPGDQLVAFQFLLNKRDVTHVVAPMGGEDLSLKQVALSLSNLIEKNTRKFKNAQARKKSQASELAKLEADSDTLETQLADISSQGDTIKAQSDSLQQQIDSVSQQADTVEKHVKELQAQLSDLQSKKAETPAKPVSTAKGPEQTLAWYGLRARPLADGAQPEGYKAYIPPEQVATDPRTKGWVEKGNIDPSCYLYGAIGYAPALSPKEISQYELEDFRFRNNSNTSEKPATETALGAGDTVPLDTIQTGAMMPTITKRATTGDNPIWFTQSTLNDIVGDAKFKINGQVATSNPEFAEQRYQMVKAALAAGFGMQRFNISGYQYIYVLRKDDDILTAQGAAKFTPAAETPSGGNPPGQTPPAATNAADGAGASDAINIDDLVKIGGNIWSNPKTNTKRVYFNNLSELYGLESSHYNTGSIKSATLNGEKISNSKAHKIMSMLNSSKFWYDESDGKFHAQGLDADSLKGLANEVRKRIAGDGNSTNAPDPRIQLLSDLKEQMEALAVRAENAGSPEKAEEIRASSNSILPVETDDYFKNLTQHVVDLIIESNEKEVSKIELKATETKLAPDTPPAQEATKQDILDRAVSVKLQKKINPQDIHAIRAAAFGIRSTEQWVTDVLSFFPAYQNRKNGNGSILEYKRFKELADSITEDDIYNALKQALTTSQPEPENQAEQPEENKEQTPEQTPEPTPDTNTDTSSEVDKIRAQLQDLYDNETNMDAYAMKLESAFNELQELGALDDNDPFFRQVSKKLTDLIAAQGI